MMNELEKSNTIMHLNKLADGMVSKYAAHEKTIRSYQKMFIATVISAYTKDQIKTIHDDFVSEIESSIEHINYIQKEEVSNGKLYQS